MCKCKNEREELHSEVHKMYACMHVCKVLILWTNCSVMLLYVHLQISVGQDWILFHDELQLYITHDQNFTFMTYFPFLSVAFHFLFAAPSKASVRYPNSAYEVYIVNTISVQCDILQQTL